MAKPKTTKHTKKSPAAPKKASKKKASATLSRSAKQSLLRPRAGAVDLAFDLVTKWKNERGLRVDQLSPAKLRSTALKARKAGDRRTKLADKQARQMQPIADAHLLAEDALWRRLLALRAAIALRARIDPAVEQRFSTLIDALKNRAAPAKPPAPTT